MWKYIGCAVACWCDVIKQITSAWGLAHLRSWDQLEFHQNLYLCYVFSDRPYTTARCIPCGMAVFRAHGKWIVVRTVCCLNEPGGYGGQGAFSSDTCYPGSDDMDETCYESSDVLFCVNTHHWRRYPSEVWAWSQAISVPDQILCCSFCCT